MPMQVSLNLHMSEIRRASTASAAAGLTKAAERLKSISLPLTPKDIGNLRDHTTVTPAGSDLVAKVSNGSVYAARQHEELGWRHPEPGTQAKYLEAPAHDNAQELGAIIAAEIRRGFGG